MTRSRPDDLWLEMGVVAKPHGLNGEFAYKPHSGNLEATPTGTLVRLALRDGTARDATLTSVRPFKAGALVRLRMEGEVLRPESLRGARLLMQRADLDELGPDEVYIADLIGLRARMPDGQWAGDVRDAVDTQPYVTLIVEGPFGGSVPYHRDWVGEPDFAAGILPLLRPPLA